MPDAPSVTGASVTGEALDERDLDDTLRELLASLISGDAEGAVSVHLITPREPSAAVARYVEAHRFPRTASTDSSHAPTFWLCAVDRTTGRPVGSMRVIAPAHTERGTLAGLRASAGGSDPFRVLERVLRPLARARVWDVADLTMLPSEPESYGTVAALALYQALGRLLEANRVEALVATLDVAVLRVLTWHLPRMFHDLSAGDSRSGAIPLLLPVGCDLTAWREQLRKDEPEREAFFFRGEGLEGLAVPLNRSLAEAGVAPSE